MAFPPIVVEISPAGAPAELRAALLDSCTRSAGEAECIDSVKAPIYDDATFAVVSWEDDSHVEVRLLAAGEGEWVIREIAFKSEDAPADRWMATGLVIGTLATQAQQPATPQASSPPAPTATRSPEPTQPPAPVPRREPPGGDARALEEALPAPPEPVTASSSEVPRIWLTLAAITGPAFDRRPWRAGGELTIQAPIASSAFFGLLGANYAQALRNLQGVNANWTTALAGIGYIFRARNSVEVEVHLEALAQRFALSAPSNARGAAPTSGQRWLGGARAGAGATWWVTESFGLTATLSGRWLAATTDVTVNRQRIATEPQLTAVLRAGVSIRF